MDILYQVHLQDIGWQEWKKNGEIAGTTGQRKRVEAIQIKLDNAPAGYNISYQVYVRELGWQGWKTNGEVAGTTGESRPVEAIQIQVIGSTTFGATYELFFPDLGWQPFTVDGVQAGPTADNVQLEAIRIQLSPVVLDAQSLVTRYTPLLYLCNTFNIGEPERPGVAEDAYPSSIDWYLQRVKLYSGLGSPKPTLLAAPSTFKRHAGACSLVLPTGCHHATLRLFPVLPRMAREQLIFNIGFSTL
jgi:hypothetical protein